MYHKIVLEDVMRAAKGVKDADQLFYQELSALLQPMTDAMYSLEEGMGHTPLFNDSGENVARSMLRILLSETSWTEDPDGYRRDRTGLHAGAWTLRWTEL